MFIYISDTNYKIRMFIMLKEMTNKLHNMFQE